MTYLIGPALSNICPATLNSSAASVILMKTMEFSYCLFNRIQWNHDQTLLFNSSSRLLSSAGAPRLWSAIKIKCTAVQWQTFCMQLVKQLSKAERVRCSLFTWIQGRITNSGNNHSHTYSTPRGFKLITFHQSSYIYFLHQNLVQNRCTFWKMQNFGALHWILVNFSAKGSTELP